MDSVITIADANFTSCTAEGLGGGMDALGGVVTIAGAKFIRCTAVSSGLVYFGYDIDGGGGVALRKGSSTGSSTVITDTVFDRCQAPNGGAILVETDSDLSISSSTFQSCSAAKGGGGLSVGLPFSSGVGMDHVESRVAQAHVSASTFDGCTAGQGGGAIVIFT